MNKGTRYKKVSRDMSIWGVVLVALVAVVLATGVRWYHLAGSPQNGPIGGPFTLIDQRGQVRSDKDFLGSYMLVYFGYTYCPDVCPVSLQTATDILDKLPQHLASQIIPVMISVDPERDTPEQLAQFIGNFHPRAVGLTGTPEQILEVSKAYRIVAKKSGEDENYLIDHTSMFFFMGPDGAYVDRFSSLAKPEAIAARLQSLMETKRVSAPPPWSR